MRKIDVTRQFFEASGPQGHFFEKTKKKIQKQPKGVCVPIFAYETLKVVGEGVDVMSMFSIDIGEWVKEEGRTFIWLPYY